MEPSEHLANRRSTMHRVVAPIDGEGRPYRRRSAAFFHDGNPDALVSPLPGSSDQFEPISVCEHLAGELGLTLNRNAAQDAARLGHLSTRRASSDARFSPLAPGGVTVPALYGAATQTVALPVSCFHGVHEPGLSPSHLTWLPVALLR